MILTRKRRTACLSRMIEPSSTRHVLRGMKVTNGQPIMTRPASTCRFRLLECLIVASIIAVLSANGDGSRILFAGHGKTVF